MAAIIATAEFSLDGFAAFVDERLPSYARPMFLRVCGHLDTTATFKISKVRLSAEGYASSTDPVYVRQGHVFAPLGLVD